MAIVLKTYGQQLEEVQNAITAVLTSQRYELNGRVQQRADLSALQQRETYLTKQYAKYGDVSISKMSSTGTFGVSFG